MKNDSVLFVVAHSDDHVLGAGGTIAKYSHQGKNVVAVVLSYGEMSHPWLKQAEAKKMRFNEAQRAGGKLGCTTIFFDLKEGRFLDEEYKEAKSKLVKLVEKHKPQKVFTHSDEDPHPDHRATLKIVKEVLEQARQSPELFTFPVWNQFTFKRRETPRLYVDVSSTFKRKVAALHLYKSQLFNAIYPLYLGMLIRALKNGSHINKRYAEMFYKITKE